MSQIRPIIDISPLLATSPSERLRHRMPLPLRCEYIIQKPNDIVNWIRKHYPAEWDGDEGRCSAHRVRTYLARKGADMYYEKLNQGCIAGWRIRQNHLWRFENGGFQGRGMKQEEAIAQAIKENEAIAAAAHKARAAEALAAGHPGIKTSMSQAGVHDGNTPIKRQRTKGNGQARRKSTKLKAEDGGDIGQDGDADLAFYPASPGLDAQFHQSSATYGQAGPSSRNTAGGTGIPIDPSLMSAVQAQGGGNSPVDMHIVQQAMQAAAAANAGQMDELEMGMQLPIEMQMHEGEDDGGDETSYRSANYAEYKHGNHPYTPHDQQEHYQSSQYGYTGAQGQVYGHTGYHQGGQ